MAQTSHEGTSIANAKIGIYRLPKKLLYTFITGYDVQIQD